MLSHGSSWTLSRFGISENNIFMGTRNRRHVLKHVGLRFFERNVSLFISITTNTELIDCFFPLEVISKKIF